VKSWSVSLRSRYLCEAALSTHLTNPRISLNPFYEVVSLSLTHTGLTVTHSAVSTDAGYNGISVADVTVSIGDDDTP